MSKKNNKIFEQLTNLFKRPFNRLFSPSFMAQPGDDMEEQIVRRSRLGKGLSAPKNGRLIPFPKLSDSYRKSRRRNKRNLSLNTRPAKSNITKTGQLLDSVKNTTRGTRVIVDFNESRKNSKLTNSKLTGYLFEQGRIFLGLSKSEKNRFRREASKYYMKRIKAELRTM